VKARVAAAAAIAALALTLPACTVTNTAPDESGIVYSDGAFHSTDFKSCVDPSTKDYSSFYSVSFKYPSGQRNFVFNGEDQAPEEVVSARDAAALKAVTKDNVEMTVNGQMTFRLNTDCDVLREFHENIGLKNDWTDTLRIYLLQPLNDAVNDATKKYTWSELYSDSAKRAEWSQTVKDSLPGRVKNAARGDYFNDFGVVLQQPRIPGELQSALEAAQVSAQQNEAQQQRNIQVQSELESIRALVEVLGPDGYNTYQAIKDGKIQIVPIPQGSGLVVQPGK